MNPSAPRQDKQEEDPKQTAPESNQTSETQKEGELTSNTYANNYQGFNYNQFPGQEDPSSNYYGFFDYSQQNYENPDYNPYFYQPVTFYSNFPRAKDYNDDASIVEAFPHLKGFNDPNFNIDAVESDDYFFIMRSSNDDNIHKAIKYHVWTSTGVNNARLQEAWNDANNPSKAKPNKIYLIYSVVNSYQFMGVAELICPPKNDVMFNYWWEPKKWYGTFDIKWLFIKDVPHKKFEHIKEENQMVTTCKDCTRLSAKSGKQILGIFKSSPNKPNIFEAFEYMDNRENILRANRDRDPSFSDQYPKDQQRGNFQKRPWKPQSEYKRLNKPHFKKYAPRPFYSDSTAATGTYSNEGSFKGYQNYGLPENEAPQYGYKGPKSYGYNYSNPAEMGGGLRVNKGYSNPDQGGMMGAYGGGSKGYGYGDYSQGSKNTSHHALRTNSDEFYTGHPEIKEFSEQFVIKKAVPKSAEKKKKPKKNLEDRIPDDFFENKGKPLSRYPDSDEERKADTK